MDNFHGDLVLTICVINFLGIVFAGAMWAKSEIDGKPKPGYLIAAALCSLVLLKGVELSLL